MAVNDRVAKIRSLVRVSITSANADLLARFYEDGLGFTRRTRARVDATRYGVPGEALVLTLSLGAQSIELVQFDRPGAPYPSNSTSHDPWFQHIAIVVSDIDAAFRRVYERVRPIPISRSGPVTLPPNTGGVRAVKLRDPELHPFELLQFPPDAMPPGWRGREPASGFCLGIDHSAIVVADTARSIAFYEALGLSVTSRSLNRGAAQDALDATPGVEVEVTGLSPRQATPHIELLCYRAPRSGPAVAAPAVAANDIAATRLILHDEAKLPLSDPDGHRLLLV